MGDDIRTGQHGDSRGQPREARTSGNFAQASGAQVGMLLLLVLVNLLVLWVLWSVMNTA